MEIVIVMGIIAGILALAIPRMSFNKMDNKKVFREIIISFKEIRNRAKLYNATYRLAVDLTPNGQSYWLEKSTNPTLLDKDFLQKERDNKNSSFRDDEKVKSSFEQDKTYIKKPRTLPDGYVIKSIESGPQEIILTEGMAYIHFFQQGMIEPIALHIVDPKKNVWTLVFNSITGQADIIDGEKSLKDLNR